MIQGSVASHIRGRIRASHEKGNPGCSMHPWGPVHLGTTALSLADASTKHLTELLSQPPY